MYKSKSFERGYLLCLLNRGVFGSKNPLAKHLKVYMMLLLRTS